MKAVILSTRPGGARVIVVPQDARKPEIYRLAGSQHVAVAADRDGLLLSEALGVRFGHEPGPPPQLVVEDAADPKNRVLI